MKAAPPDWIPVVHRFLAGDRVAFLQISRLITGFLVQLRAYDFRDEWEDLIQEVLLSLVANARAGRLPDAERFLAYVRIITRNKFIDRLKSRLQHHEKEALPWDDETARLASVLGGTDAGGGHAAEVWSAVRDLPLQHQQVLDGIYRQGKTYQQVADETGIPLGTVKRWLRAALMTLRDQFREDIEPG